MSALQTPGDIGNAIRRQRKALGWDQAKLAHEIGVSRQWIIDIEKGKARAELQLVLRALHVLGLRFSVTTPADTAATSSAAFHPAPLTTNVDINAILDRYTHHRIVPPHTYRVQETAVASDQAIVTEQAPAGTEATPSAPRKNRRSPGKPPTKPGKSSR